ncbi:MAG: PocR ligand-binding domain-containing protein [Candidatus Limivicinus sp.]
MNVLFNSNRLSELLNNLQLLTGIWVNIFDADGKDIRLFGNATPFCQHIQTDPEGRSRCEDCDARAVEKCAALGRAYQYRCHAGLKEIVVPIYDQGVPIAYMVFGQLLDDTPQKQQWEATVKTLGWYGGDMLELKDAFSQLRQYSEREIRAFTEILEALTHYVLLEGMIHSAQYSDQQKLEMYIDQHYMEKLSLKQISRELNMGTTKLCAVAKKLSGDGSVTRLISQRRVQAAKRLLLREDIPISTVAERVGFSDYNYFTKIFKSIEGVTPSAYRKRNGQH